MEPVRSEFEKYMAGEITVEEYVDHIKRQVDASRFEYLARPKRRRRSVKMWLARRSNLVFRYFAWRYMRALRREYRRLPLDE